MGLSLTAPATLLLFIHFPTRGLHRSVEIESDSFFDAQDPYESDQEDDYGPVLLSPPPAATVSTPGSRPRGLPRRKNPESPVNNNQHASKKQQDVVLAGMKTADYSLLLETLAAALRDVSQDSFDESLEFDDDEDDEEEDDDDFESDAEDSNAREGNSVKLPQDIPLPPSPTLAPKGPTSKNINKTIFSNLDALVSLILPDWRAAGESSNETDEGDHDTEEDDSSCKCECKEPPTPCHITKLPTETLTRILSMARQQLDSNACECGSTSCPSAKPHYQRHFLSLRLLSKSLLPATTAAAMAVVRIRSRGQIHALLSTIKTASPERAAELSTAVKHLEIKVPALSPPFMQNNSPNSPPYLGSRPSRNRSSAFPWLQTPESPVASTSSSEDKEQTETVSPSDQTIGPLVKACPSLAVFDLSVSRSGSYSYTSWSMLSDFLETGLQPALSGTLKSIPTQSEPTSSCLFLAAPALKTLIFKQCVDFGELEQILLDCKTITELRLEGGVDNLDNRDDVIEEQHQCRLNSFCMLCSANVVFDC